MFLMKNACVFFVIKEGVLNEPIFHNEKGENKLNLKKLNDKNIMKAMFLNFCTFLDEFRAVMRRAIMAIHSSI